MNYNTRNTDKIALLHAKHNFFKNYFFPSTVIEWKKLDPNFRSAASLRVFKIICLKFISPSPESVFNCHNCKGTKYLTRLCFSLNDLHEHKLNIVFKILWIRFAYVALMLKQIHICFFTGPCLVIKDAPSWAQLMMLIVLLQKLMIRYWLMFFSLVRRL